MFCNYLCTCIPNKHSPYGPHSWLSSNCRNFRMNNTVIDYASAACCADAFARKAYIHPRRERACICVNVIYNMHMIQPMAHHTTPLDEEEILALNVERWRSINTAPASERITVTQTHKHSHRNKYKYAGWAEKGAYDMIIVALQPVCKVARFRSPPPPRQPSTNSTRAVRIERIYY